MPANRASTRGEGKLSYTFPTQSAIDNLFSQGKKSNKDQDKACSSKAQPVVQVKRTELEPWTDPISDFKDTQIDLFLTLI